MTCPTCAGSRRVFNPEINGFQNCPDSSPVYAQQTAPPPQPKVLEIHATSVQMQPGDEYVNCLLNGIEYDEILRQVPIAEAARYYGGNILDHIDPKEIRAYLNASEQR